MDAAHKIVMVLDKLFFGNTGGGSLNPNAFQKFSFSTLLHTAVGLALYIFPGQPGAAS